MSAGPQGAGWWEASDGAWYAPETHPDPSHRARFTSPVPELPPSDVGAYPDYPARLAIRRDTRIARWRPFLHLVMAIPHLFIQYVINIVAFVCVVLAWFAIVITGRMPESLHNFIAMAGRYGIRIFSHVLLMTERYPPFEYELTAQDPEDYPAVRVDYDYAPTRRSRLRALLRYVLILPHAFVLTFVVLAAYVVAVLHWFAVLVTGRPTTALGDFLIGVARWLNRATAYFYLLTDDYPPFSIR